MTATAMSRSRGRSGRSARTVDHGPFAPGPLVRRPARVVVQDLYAGRVGVGVDWQRATTRHGASLYPFQIDQGFGVRGPLVGVNVSAGMEGFFFDPFELYPHTVTSPNMIVLGDVGQGKSSLVKCFARRELAVYGPGRFLAILDPKGEYAGLARALELTTITLTPGGRQRVNPMDPPGHIDETNPAGLFQSRQELAAALTATILNRPLTPLERGVLDSAIRTLCLTGRPFTLPDVIDAVRAPGDDVVGLARRNAFDVAREASDVVFALTSLVTGPLAGMFDGPTTAPINLDGPGFVLDLSTVFTNDTALPLVMLCATAWMTSLFRRHDRTSRVIQIVDECWAAIRHSAGYFQAWLKLSRSLGLSTVLLCHRPSDLTAQTDAGTSAHEIAAGLIADCQTRVLLRPPDDELDNAATLFKLTDRQTSELARMPRARALWLINKHPVVVHHTLGPGDLAICNTDTNMRA